MKISVITVCFNEFESIERTLLSVFNQTFRSSIEYIVIDGQSNDGTKELLYDHKENIDFLICEEDAGLYDAMNKGISLATGDYILFLNSGDVFFAPNAVENAVNKIEPGSTIIYFDSYVRKQDGSLFPEKCAPLVEMNNRAIFRHGACFIKTAVHRGTLYDLARTDFGFALDFDFLYKMYIGGEKFQYVEMFLIEYLLDGISNNIELSLVYNSRIRLRRASRSREWLIRKKLRIKQVVKKSYLFYAGRLLVNFVRNYALGSVALCLPFWALRKSALKSLGCRLGNNSKIDRRLKVFGPRNLKVGNNTHINGDVFIDARGGCSIGDSVSISPRAMIITGSHDVQSTSFSELHRPITIEDFVWIGAGATILQGVTVGRGGVVAAGAVVTRNVGPGEIVAGCPAKVIANRRSNLHYQCRSGMPFT